MVNILDSIWKTVSAPFSGFFKPQYPNNNGYVNSPSNLNIGVRQPQPYRAPPQPPSPHIELMQLEQALGLPVSGFDDKDAVLYLPKMREELQKYRTKQAEKSADQAKYAAGLQEIAQKDMQYKKLGTDSYYAIQSDRIQKAAQVAQKHQNENAPYINYLANQQASQNQYAPVPPIKFG